MDDIVAAAKCPICYEIPRPGSDFKYGMCSNGHVTCSQCAGRILESQRKCCPVCNIDGMYFESKHYLANLIFRAAFHVCFFKCFWCEVDTLGENLADHERECPKRKLKCPVGHCTDLETYDMFYSLAHPCVRNLVEYNALTGLWALFYSFEELSIIERGNPRVSPFLLTHPTIPKFRAYLLPYREGLRHLSFIIGWMDTKSNVSHNIQSLKVHISCFVYTAKGMVGETFTSGIHFQNEYATRKGMLSLPWDKFKAFRKFSESVQCPICPNRKENHLHINVKLHSSFNC